MESFIYIVLIQSVACVGYLFLGALGVFGNPHEEGWSTQVSLWLFLCLPIQVFLAFLIQ